MSLTGETPELTEIIDHLTDKLGGTITSDIASQAGSYRYAIGKLHSDFLEYLRNNTFTTELSDIFDSAYDLRVARLNLVNIRNQLLSESATGEIAQSVILCAGALCLATEAKLIAEIKFNCRDDVDVMLDSVRLAFEPFIEMAGDSDVVTYRSLMLLQSALVEHLANIARPLPRMITFNLAAHLPALTLANRLYYDPTRWNELVLENKAVHPLFMQRQLRGLAA